MIYDFARVLLKIYFAIYLGPIKIVGKENLPSSNFILVAPHHYLWDAPVLAVTIVSTTFFFMAKKELFSNLFLGTLLGHLNAFPVDRQKPGTRSIKIPIRELRRGSKSMIIFPTGSRFSTEVKPGYLLIAHASRVPVVPATIKRSKWGQTVVQIGKPYFVNEAVNKRTTNRHYQNLLHAYESIGV